MDNNGMCVMEQEILTVRERYKPYFDLEKEHRKLNQQFIDVLHMVEKILLFCQGLLIADLIYKIFIL